MFKKRGPVKTVNIAHEIIQIEASQDNNLANGIEAAQPAPNTLRRHNNSTIEVEQTDPALNRAQTLTVQEEAKDNRIRSSCQNYNIFKVHAEPKKTQNLKDYIQDLMDEQENFKQKDLPMEEIQEEQSVEEQSAGNVYQIKNQPLPRQTLKTYDMEQMEVEDQEADNQIVVRCQSQNSEVLEVEQDLGMGSSSEQDGFEATKMRQALGNGYFQARAKAAAQRKSSTKVISKQRQILDKLSVSTVMTKINKELSLKHKNLDLHNEEIQQVRQKYERENQHLAFKKRQLAQSKQRFRQIQQVLEFVYKKGHTIKQFNLQAVLDQIKKEEESQEQDEVQIY